MTAERNERMGRKIQKDTCTGNASLAYPEEVKQDLEGMQTMKVLGNNMAFFLNCKNERRT